MYPEIVTKFELNLIHTWWIIWTTAALYKHVNDSFMLVKQLTS